MSSIVSKKQKVESKECRTDLPGSDSYVVEMGHLPDDARMSASVFAAIWDLHPKERGFVKMFGKKSLVPRYHAVFGPSYKFNGMTDAPLPLDHPYLLSLLAWVQRHSGKPYEGMLINWYKSGLDYVGPHSDDEKEIVPGEPIYSFSFGQARDFVIRSKKPMETGGYYRKVISMTDNSLIIMGGEMQQHFKHSVPKRALSTCPNERINITFRLLKA
jgi:alkylated DNA repair dioxygenase AlkB